MIRLDFADAPDMINFLTTVREIEGWETVIFRLSASNGVQMDVKTNVKDPLGIAQYLELTQLKSTITNFINQHKHLTINAEIKLKFPDNQRRIMDPANDYNAFYFNLYATESASYATISFLERAKTLSTSPVISWGVYVTGLYNDWKRKNGNY